MPAVLVEVGYLTNAEDERFLLSDEGQDLRAGYCRWTQRIFLGSQELSLEHQGTSDLDEERSPDTSESGIRPMEKVYFNGSAKDGKQVALTFDDGPDAIVTPKILDILKETILKLPFYSGKPG